MAPNAYSPPWFAVFLDPISPAQTAAAVAALARWLPQPAYRRVLDVCCGSGRHARALAARGYAVTGVDRDAGALAAAGQASGPAVRYYAADMRDLTAIPGPFDAALNLWQSFGYFDAATNAAVLRGIRAKLRPGGRCILDLYHRDFYAAHQGRRVLERAGRTIVEETALAGDRLTVHLRYHPGDGEDRFEWQLFTPEAITALAAACGFRRLLACADWDEATPPAPAIARMQLVFEAQ